MGTQLALQEVENEKFVRKAIIFDSDKFSYPAGYEIPLIVDIDSMTLPERVNVYFSHDYTDEMSLGVASDFSFEGSKLVAKIKFFDNPRTISILDRLSQGFHYDISIGIFSAQDDYTWLEKGDKYKKFTITKPTLLKKNTTLREVSVVHFGANEGGTNLFKLETDKNEEVMEEGKVEPVTNVVTEATKLEASIPQANEFTKAYYDEKLRRETILAIAKDETNHKLVTEAIDDGWDFKKFSQHWSAAHLPSNEDPVTNPTVGKDILECAALLSLPDKVNAQGESVKRKFMDANYAPQLIERAQNLGDLSLVDYVRLVFEMDPVNQGKRLPLLSSNFEDYTRLTFSTVSLPEITRAILNKSLLASFYWTDESWRRIAQVSSVSNFDTYTYVRMSDNLQFEKLAKGAPLQHGTFSEEKYEKKIDTFGVMCMLDRKTLLSDSLGTFASIPFRFNVNANNTISRDVWTSLTTNADGFFSAAHGNYASGNNTALTIDSLHTAFLAMTTMVDAMGMPFMNDPTYLVVPPQLEATAQALVGPYPLMDAAEKPIQFKPEQGKLQVVSSKWLSNAKLPNNSQTGWYLFMQPAEIPVVDVGFLYGKQTPTIESIQPGPEYFGMGWKAYIDYGVSLMDYRGARFLKGVA